MKKQDYIHLFLIIGLACLLFSIGGYYERQNTSEDIIKTKIQFLQEKMRANERDLRKSIRFLEDNSISYSLDRMQDYYTFVVTAQCVLKKGDAVTKYGELLTVSNKDDFAGIALHDARSGKEVEVLVG